jgi:hypothetical protein
MIWWPPCPHVSKFNEIHSNSMRCTKNVKRQGKRAGHSSSSDDETPRETLDQVVIRSLEGMNTTENRDYLNYLAREMGVIIARIAKGGCFDDR